MGKGVISILILSWLFIFSGEVNAHSLPTHKKAAFVVQSVGKVLSADTGILLMALKKSAIQIAPAYRSSHVLKDIGSSGLINLSIFAASHPLAIGSKRAFTKVNSSHLFHIYPFHHFW